MSPTAPPQNDPATNPEAHLAPEVELVRVRLMLVVGATFVIALLSGGTLVAVFAPWVGGRLEQLLATVPAPAWLTFVAALLSAVALVAWMAREVVRPAEELAASRHDLGQLYESARSHALEDSLTGLSNHRAFQEEFERQLSASGRYGMSLALLLIDLDDFKVVNDSAGHAAGDDLLVEVGRILRAQVRQSDRAFRIGGDEFAVLLPHCDADGASVIANRLLAACLEPRPASGFPRGFAFSAGVTSAPAFGATRDQLFAQADEALYRAKRDGRCGVRVYDPASAGAIADARALAERSAAVVEVIRSGGLHPVYQPMVDLASGRVVAFEGLIRLPPDTPFTDPGHLFRAAEATGRTFDLDFACIATVLSGAATLGKELALSINISPRTLEAPEFVPDRLVARLAAAGFEPDRVIVEVTERDQIEDIERIRNVLGRLQAFGIRTAADDVGAGNAGLRLLSQIHFDIVKLDLSLVQEGARRETSLAVIRSLADLAARWGAMVVAEGVETPAQLHLLRSIGVPL
ncbi:MAG TPA: EAL domain-containing protein, partial [Candidatus Dormibacteraeota bacterium]|nr:EAL domain-containing protein [Candidatus Dormibacteraeota bacterium]